MKNLSGSFIAGKADLVLSATGVSEVTSNRGKTPEEREHDDDIEQEGDEFSFDDDDDNNDDDDETLLGVQLRRIPGSLPEGWNMLKEKPLPKEINLDHATETEWQRFLASLEDE